MNKEDTSISSDISSQVPELKMELHYFITGIIDIINVLTSFLRCAESASSGVLLVTDSRPVVLNFS